MGEGNYLLTDAEQAALTTFASVDELDGRRAQALLALNNGRSQAEAAAETGLTRGQVNYILRKFRQQRLGAFPQLAEAPEQVVDPPPAEDSFTAEKQSLLADLDRLLADLKTAVSNSADSPYSPFKMLTLVRENVERLAPDAQLNILQSLQGMDAKDLLDIDTWKGIAYTITYAAQFQAEQTRDKLNEQLPEPLKPDTVLKFMQANVERFTPQIVQNVVGTFQGMDREAMRDPNTWKALGYMMKYAAEHQAEQTRQKLNKQLPHPLKPDTVLGFMKSTYEAVTPDMAKAVIQGFAGMSREDLANPDTWRGMWQMLNYSIQFQIEQLKQRLASDS